MKFFTKNATIQIKKKLNRVQTHQSVDYVCGVQNLTKFGGFILKSGTATRHKNILSAVLKNLNFFVFFKKDFVFNNYNQIWWLLNSVVEKNKNFTYIFDMVVDLVKPPFVIKSTLLSKKKKKKNKSSIRLGVSMGEKN